MSLSLGEAAERASGRVAVGDGVGEFVAEEAEAVSPEEASAEEVEEWIEDRDLFDAEHAWVTGGVCGGDSAHGDVLAAVPVRAFLVATFHPSSADAAADPAAERVEAPVLSACLLCVVLRRCECGVAAVVRGALFDLSQQLVADERLVGRGRAPDPLVGWADEGAAGSFVVAAPDVVAGVLGVSEHRLDL